MQCSLGTAIYLLLRFDYAYRMTLRRLTPPAVTALVLAAEVAIVTALHRLGSAEGLAVQWGDIRSWLTETATDDVLVALVRLAALALAWWLLASTALYLTASVLRLRGLVRVLRWATLPGVRGLIDGVAAGSIVAGSILGAVRPAVAQPPPTSAQVYVPRPAGDTPAYTPVPAGDGAPATTAPATAATSVPATPDAPTAPTTTAAPAEPSTKVRSTNPPTTKQSAAVRRGDNLWSIAERHLSHSTGRPIGDISHDELRAYWLRLVEANRARLASGDPDLIYPGEVVVPPDVAER